MKPPARLESLTGIWLGHQVSFSFDSSTKSWFALAGISLETAPGTYTLELAGERLAKTANKKVAFSRKFAVARGKYPTDDIDVVVRLGKNFSEPGLDYISRLDALEHRLSEILGCRVDVIEEPVRKERFQKEIDRDRALAF